jgi:signal transduction histidine kinase
VDTTPVPKNKGKILYVEDNRENRMLIEAVLTMAGYEVVLAEDGMRGIKKAIEELPDLILMDINLPDMDGYETATIIRNMRQFQNIHIIALTASADRGKRELSLVAGCDGFIEKPINIHKFVGQVEEFLQGKRECMPESQEILFLRQYSKRLVKRLETKVNELTRINQDLGERVTERTKKTEEAYKRLEQYQRKLIHSETMASLGEMSATVAHETRNQLQKIKAGIQYFQEYTPLNPQEAGVFNAVIRGVEQLEQIVNDLLDFAKPEKLNMESVNFVDLVEETIEEFRSRFEEKKITCDRRLEGNMPPIYLDRLKIKQVLKNIIQNAVQSMKDGGQLEISGQKESVEQLKKRFTFQNIPIESQAALRFECKDNGCGMPLDLLPLVFRPFFTTRSKGMGLGLAFSKKMIEYHDGDIFITSQIGTGTSLIFCIPYK